MPLSLSPGTANQNVLRGAPAGDVYGTRTGGRGTPRSLCVLAGTDTLDARLGWHDNNGDQYAVPGVVVGVTQRPSGSLWVSASTGRLRFAWIALAYEVNAGFTYVITQERDPEGLLSFSIVEGHYPGGVPGGYQPVPGTVLQFNPSVSPQAMGPGYSHFSLKYATNYTLICNTPRANGQLPFRTAASASAYPANVAGGLSFVKIEIYGPSNNNLAVNTY